MMQKQLRGHPLLLGLYLCVILACGVLFPNDVEEEPEEALPIPESTESFSAYVQTSPTPSSAAPQKIILPSPSKFIMEFSRRESAARKAT